MKNIGKKALKSVGFTAAAFLCLQGCSATTPTKTLESSDPMARSLNDMLSVFDEVGMKVEIDIHDYDSNDLRDYVVYYKSGDEDYEDTHFLMAVSGALGYASEELGINYDKGVGVFNGLVYEASAADIAVCYHRIIGDVDADTVEGCVVSAWELVDMVD